MKKINMAGLFYKKNKDVCGCLEGDAAIIANAEANEAVANITATGTAVSLGGGAVVYAHTLSKTGNRKKATGLACFTVGVGLMVTDKISRRVGYKVFTEEKARMMRPIAYTVDNETVADETPDVEYVEA